MTIVQNIYNFFYPKESIYLYNADVEQIKLKLRGALKRDFRLFDENNLTGDFISENAFFLKWRFDYFIFNRRWITTITGKINSISNDNTEIIVAPKPRIHFYVIFFICIVSGLISLFRYVQYGGFDLLAGGVLGLIIAPLLCLKIWSVLRFALIDNFEKYFDSKLRES